MQIQIYLSPPVLCGVSPDWSPLPVVSHVNNEAIDRALQLTTNQIAEFKMTATHSI